MKKPKLMKRHCPYCNKHTDHKVFMNKNRGRNATHPMSYGSTTRVRGRGLRRGYGGHGRYSKPTKPKMSGKKLSKKTDLRYTCSTCQKTHAQRWGIRAKKIEMI
ncbi:MAG: 50S ribosomal protein L44e [Nanoarchaeota archaeon]